MARPRRDGAPAASPNKRKLTDQFIKSFSSDGRRLVHDTKIAGFACACYASGRKVYKVLYPCAGKTRWYTLGRADAINLKDARRLASKVLLQVAGGEDPQAQRQAQRSQGTFQELTTLYIEHAKKKNKSWKQTDNHIQRYLLPRWGKLQAKAVTRADAKAMLAGIKAPVLANQVLAAASSIFTFGIREEIVTSNPCLLVEKNPTKSRERILSDAEIPKFWTAFDEAGPLAGTALKLLLLLGQRPGEIRFMHRSHISDGWWSLPGSPDPAIKWPGTKNSLNHRIWIPQRALELLAEIDGEGSIFGGLRISDCMQKICADLGVERCTPHDLRRSNGTMITRLGFGRDAMNRIQNHVDGGISSIYDRHQYAEENKKIMETVASKIMALVGGDEGKNVYRPKFAKV
jgi:integrase